MKKLLTAVLFSLTVLVAQAQKEEKIKAKDVPSNITKAFNTMYSSVKDVKWEMEGYNYEAHFTHENMKKMVKIDREGAFMEEKRYMEEDKLPQPVKDYMSKNVAGKKIKNPARVMNAAGTSSYELEAGGKRYWFDENGKFIKMS